MISAGYIETQLSDHLSDGSIFSKNLVQSPQVSERQGSKPSVLLRLPKNGQERQQSWQLLVKLRNKLDVSEHYYFKM